MAREKSGYSRKVEAGTNPAVYDKNSKSFNEGAWKNHPPEMREKLRRRLVGAND